MGVIYLGFPSAVLELSFQSSWSHKIQGIEAFPETADPASGKI